MLDIKEHLFCYISTINSERLMLMQIELNKIQELLDWMKTKLYLHTKVEQANKRYVKRGQVYNCYFGIGVGNEIQKLRPCIILQNNIGNAKSGNIIVAPITHTYKDIPSIIKINTQYNEDGTILLDGYAYIMCEQSKTRKLYNCTTYSRNETIRYGYRNIARFNALLCKTKWKVRRQIEIYRKNKKRKKFSSRSSKRIIRYFRI